MRRVVHLGDARAPPAIAPCRARDWEALVLVKPQFEAGREVPSVVRDPRCTVACFGVLRGGRRVACARRGRRRLEHPGPKGNRGSSST